MKQAEQVQEMLGFVDPALVEEADCPRQRRPRRMGRLALAAACLCVVLLGSVWAVSRAGGFRMVEFFEDLIFADQDDDTYNGYNLWGGVDFIPLDELPQEVLDTAAEHPASTVAVDVHSWAEAEVYFALDLPENPWLDRVRQTTFRTDLSSDQVGPTQLECKANYRDGDVRLTVKVTAHTERMKHPDNELYQGVLFSEGTQFTTEERSYDNGLPVLLATVEFAPGDTFYDYYGERLYRAHFAVNGVWYWVDASSQEAPEQALETLEAMLNSFVL
ncbi:hypothetical protein [Flavonifractor sp. AGMB03687]|uniref:hypothetical protein n=1 Tax=Flavonifractor sp. AGMB03687 TaxID=2785133 RepID=UPI001AE07E82|nr:hypothetical protein [Flavonifractor sp. AGMB03687]